MDKELLKKLKSIEGARLLKKTKFEYSKEIIEIIKANPNILEELLTQLQMTEEELYNCLTVEDNTNITVYDEALNQGIKLKNKLKNNAKIK